MPEPSRTQRWLAQARGVPPRLRRAWERFTSGTRALVLPRSLARQMAIISVSVGVGAIILTAIISSVVVSNSFSSYLHTELRNGAQIEASRINSLINQRGQDFHDAVDQDLIFNYINGVDTGSQGQFWAVDSSGAVLFPRNGSPLRNNPDLPTLIPALRNTLDTGQTNVGDLPDREAGWFHLSDRGYGVAPIYADGTPSSHVIGAVAYFSGQSLARAAGPVFIRTVDRTLLIAGIIVTILVAVGSIYLARSIARPLHDLQVAAARMGSGDLSARVTVDPEEMPAEIEQLATTFNDMAAKLEHDVDELRRQERLQRELVANVAHELATPLTAIRGYSEALAEDDALPREQRTDFSRIINRETVRLMRLVDQLRQVARLEAGTEKMDLHPTPLRMLAEDTLDVLAGESEQLGVAIHNEISADLPPVSVDTDRLTQVLLNLVDNAVRHTPAGGQVTVAAHPDGVMVWVTVADTGPGIAAEDLPRVFDRFYRADAARNRATGGTGLGLAIVKGIVEAHGGQVRAENNPDGGARMSFSLHLAAAPVATLVG